MKVLLPCVLVCLLMLSSLLPASGQISITASDVGAQLIPGTVITTKTDTAHKTVNIGPHGAATWDFSAAVMAYISSSASVSPDTTPFFSYFPTSTHALKIGSLYVYLDLGTDFSQLGFGMSIPFDTRITNTPPQVLFQLPMSMGTSWTSTSSESTVVVLPPPAPPYVSVSERIVSNTVDAYGSMTLPGGGVYQALRLKTDIRTTTNAQTSRLITYQFIAKNGATVSVSTTDTLQPDTGSIATDGISWNGPAGTTGVEEIGGGVLPTRFALEQNYPNPFNPSTTIRFSVAREAFVTLKIYSLLGEEITTLATGQFAQGTYTVSWDASGLPSGVYLCRLQAGPVSETRKLILMR